MNDMSWDGIDRRGPPRVPPNGGSPDAEFWKYVVSQFEAINVKMNVMHMDMISHKAELEHVHKDVSKVEGNVSHIETDISEIKKAFPKTEDGDRDYIGHNKDHTTRRDAAMTWRELWRELFKKVFNASMIAILIFVFYAVIDSLKDRLK